MPEINSLISANAIPVTVDSRVLISIYSLYQIAIPVRIKIIQIDENGNLIEYVQSVSVLSSTNFPEVVTIQLTNGRLISITVWTTVAALQDGELFASISLRQGSVNDVSRIFVLTSGYVSTGASLVYPVSEPRSFNNTFWAIVAGGSPDPAAGSEIFYETNTFSAEHILGGNFTLVTNATVANRIVTVIITIRGVIIAVVTSRTTQLISTTFQYILWRGPNLPADTATHIFLPIPDDAVGPELTIETLTANLNAGDNFGQANILTRRRVWIA